MVQTTGAMMPSGPGRGENDPRNASVAIDGLSRDFSALVLAATEVVQDHIRDCQASVLLAEKHVRQRAADANGGMALAWRYFASPAILDLAKALRALVGPLP